MLSCLLFLVAPLAALAFDPATLFPIKVRSAWTTLASAPAGTGAQAVPLDDRALGVHKKMGGLTYQTVPAPGSAPPGSMSWPAIYPAGSYKPSAEPRGGLGYYFPGPQFGWWNDTKVTQILFSYAVQFPSDFNAVKGGKLPGPYGGSTDELAYACSGGRQEERDECFNLRLMWRGGLDGEIYAYLPTAQVNTDAVNALKGSHTDDTYGYEVATGSFKFAAGDYTVVAQRVQLNTVGQSNGELELWVNGKSVIHVTNLQIRTRADVLFRGVHFQTFFGGGDATWASPTQQTVYFAGISGGIVESGASAAEGKPAYPQGPPKLSSMIPSKTKTDTKSTGTGHGDDAGGSASRSAGFANSYLAVLVAAIGFVVQF